MQVLQGIQRQSIHRRRMHRFHFSSIIILLLSSCCSFISSAQAEIFTKHFGAVLDIDECQDKVTYPCAGICKNTVGGYNCSCSPGKSLINGVCVKKQKSVWMAPVVGRFRGSLHALFFMSPAFTSDGICGIFI